MPFKMVCDSGASHHHLDNELLRDIEDEMFDYVKLDPPMSILTAGRHLFCGTGKGVLHFIAIDRQGSQRSVRLPAIIVRVRKHLFIPEH